MTLRWFPTMGYVHPWENLGEGLWRLALPSLTLGTFFAGLVACITRSFGTLLGGAVLTETVFNIPGMGRLTVTAIFNREYHVVQGAVLVGVVFVIVVNLMVAILVEECPSVFIMHVNEHKVLAKHVQGFQPIPADLMNMHTVWLNKA